MELSVDIERRRRLAVGPKDLTALGVEKANADVDGGVLSAFEQDLGRSKRRLSRETFGKQASESPALLIFDRRRAVGIKNVSLKKHGVGDALRALDPPHASASSLSSKA